MKELEFRVGLKLRVERLSTKLLHVDLHPLQRPYKRFVIQVQQLLEMLHHHLALRARAEKVRHIPQRAVVRVILKIDKLYPVQIALLVLVVENVVGPEVEVRHGQPGLGRQVLEEHASALGTEEVAYALAVRRDAGIAHQFLVHQVEDVAGAFALLERHDLRVAEDFGGKEAGPVVLAGDAQRVEAGQNADRESRVVQVQTWKYRGYYHRVVRTVCIGMWLINILLF